MSNLFMDFISGKGDIEGFYPAGHFSDSGSYKRLATNRKLTVDRNKLAYALLHFNNFGQLPPKTIENIEALRDGNTFTVVSGQQMGFLGGPLFTFLKIISVIRLSEILSVEHGIKTVPVFWLADDDHDYEEIASIAIPDANGLSRFSAGTNPMEGFAAGKLPMGDSAVSSIQSLIGSIQPTEFTPALAELLNSTWKADGNWLESFSKMIYNLFGHKGLILVGSESSKIKNLLKPALLDYVTHADEYEKSLRDVSTELGKKYHEQAAVGQSLLFYHDDIAGRVKLSRTGNQWSLGDDGKSFSTEALLKELESNPERFSPNVFLRPILQEYLLPNLAYVGGPSEVAYFGQMSGLFKQSGIAMPVIVPRLSATFIEPPIARIMDGFSFRFDEYNQRVEDLHKAYIERQNDGKTEAFFSGWRDEARNQFESKEGFLSSIDPSLKGALKSSMMKTLNEIDRLEQKLNRSIKQQDMVQLNRLERIGNALFPEGTPQERVVNGLYFLNKYGFDLIDGLCGNLMPGLDSPGGHHLVYL